jgi:hypothetical protein
MLRPPSAHLSTRVNDRLDVIFDVINLPASSCKEMERKVKGSRTALMSASGRLVTHIRRFGSCDSISSSTSIRAF